MNRALSAKPMAGLRAGFKEAAEELADDLVTRRRLDAIVDIAEAYPLSVFPKAVGLGRDGLENLLPYGAMVFNAFGPRNAHFDAVMAEAAKVVPWINAQCAREALSPAGLGAIIWAAVDTGEITAEEAPLLVRSMLSAGLDTTIIGIGNALYAFATNPAQWQALREKPTLARPAFDEVLRWESPIQTFFRTTSRKVDIGGVEIPQARESIAVPGFCESRSAPLGRTRALRHQSPGRRSRRLWRRHSFVVGQMLARLEAEMIMTALAARVERIGIIGEPQRRLSNSLRQLASLPVELIAA